MAIINAFLAPSALILIVFLANLKPTASDYLKEVCSLPLDEGTDCPTDQPRFQYYFDKEAEECVYFRYKGCDGNGLAFDFHNNQSVNRFVMQDDCTDNCQVEWLYKKNKKDGGEGPSRSENCELPKKVGPCRANIRQWFYDKQMGECTEFTYGGCKGNKNRFNTETQCKATCQSAAEQEKSQQLR